MFGRIFGRGKDDQDQAVCAECGRTLLAGEWTQMIVDEHGDERIICSLCGQAYVGQDEPVAAAPAPANNGRMRETRVEARNEEQPEAAPVAEPPARDTHAESDAFWQALKDKDAQIEGLKAELARAEAERQELAGRFARLGTAVAGAGARLAHRRLVRAGRAHLGRDAGRVRRRDGGAPRGRVRPAPAAGSLADAGDGDARRRAGRRGGRGRGGRRRGDRRRGSRRGGTGRSGRARRRRGSRRGRRRAGRRGARRRGARPLAHRVRRHAAHRRHLGRDARGRRGRGPEHRRDRRGRRRGGGRRRRQAPFRASRPPRSPQSRRPPRPRPRPSRSRSCSAASTCST